MPEIVSVGLYDAAHAVKNREVTKNRKTTMFELELPTADGGLSYIDEESAVIARDVVICAKPGQLRHTRLPFRCRYIHLTAREGEVYDRLMNLPSFVRVEDRERIDTLFRRLSEYYETGEDGYLLLIHSLLLELVFWLSEHSRRQSFSEKSNNKEVIDAAIHYIRKNLTADLSLSALSERASFSPIHFHNCFKRSTGKTLHEFVEEQRLRQAINLLIGTELTLSEIAMECGFSSQSYFNSVFRRRMGKTPRAYAKECLARYEK